MEIQKATKPLSVTFSPTEKQVAEIEKWLIAERKKSREGFYCNWNIIKSSFDSNELAAISLNNKTIGFATWRLTTDKTARLEITEVKPTNRNNGVGKKLTYKVLNFLKDKNIFVVDLQCSPESSEPIWKHLGFREFPDPPNYNFNTGWEKSLYIILSENLQPEFNYFTDETIELWNDEPYRIYENTHATYIWNVNFIEGTRKLSKPIVHPSHYDWRLRWKINGKTIIDGKVKYFGTEIYYGQFIIIQELPDPADLQ